MRGLLGLSPSGRVSLETEPIRAHGLVLQIVQLPVLGLGMTATCLLHNIHLAEQTALPEALSGLYRHEWCCLPWRISGCHNGWESPTDICWVEAVCRRKENLLWGITAFELSTLIIYNYYAITPRKTLTLSSVETELSSVHIPHFWTVLKAVNFPGARGLW